ncbi:MAG: hypothetical protein PF545_01700 [Elusimicrobia bacterium]|jgi:hypothetical protein|nr:hypothetical protein [Elusimicrobiota bacterium]
MEKIITGLSGILVFVLVCSNNIYAEAVFTPVADISLNGGQYFLEAEPSSFGGSANIDFAPALNFSKESALIPMINMGYNGTQDVHDLVGGGTLTRESADIGGTLKYITNIAGLKTKLRVNYKKSLINETKDEDWTDGLFDYNRILFGAQAERLFAGYDVSLAVDFYSAQFPNYASLVSQTEEEFNSSIDTNTHTEISQNAGTNVLDYSDIKAGIDASKKHTDVLSAAYGYSIDLRNYADQTVVESNGSFSSGKRKDTINSINAGLDYAYRRAVIGLKSEMSILSSNQNSYDADATKFIDNYYSYIKGAVTPSFALYLGKGERLSRFRMWWDIDLTGYAGRLAREEEGGYVTDKVKQLDNSFGISYRYPVFDSFYAHMQFSRRAASSNMKYEGNYKYNYTATNYYAGLNWQY